MNWTSAGELERWADTLEARARLPQLVRKLIFATDSSVVRRDFPAGEGIQRRGWDGILESDAGNDFVPLGISRWEMGADKDPRSKANKDYKTRTANPVGVNPTDTTFIFVTPRKWETKEEWCDEKRKEGVWKDVRVYDSSNLEEWLETAPAVDIWISRISNRRPQGIADIDEHWENLVALTDPPLLPQVFLTSRSENCKQLTGWLAAAPSVLTVEVASPSEVVDFVAAYIASLDETERVRQDARIVVVENRDAWQILSTSRNRLILIQHPRLVIESELIAQGLRNGHHVLICTHWTTDRGATLRLTRPIRHELRESLIQSGINEQEASRFSENSRGSLPILKRCLSKIPSINRPDWSLPPDAIALVPLVLAGGWDDSSEADQDILSRLAGRAYGEVLELTSRLLTSEDPPFLRNGSGWGFLSHEDVWNLLVSSVARAQLETFAQIAVEVLGVDDPALDLPQKDRWCAALYDKKPKHSGFLREGFVETLALLAAKDVSRNIQGIDVVSLVNYIVKKLIPEGATWQRWATLSSFLPLLAEASPEVLLDRLEKDLSSSDSQVVKLFDQEGEPLFGSSPHTGLLWALENLSWNPAYLTQSSIILARLAANDPGGRLANRPMRSLMQIFLPWLPQTEASSEQRIKILDKLLSKEPEVGWKLLISLLPDTFDSTSYTHKPRYRNWGMSWSNGLTNVEYAQQINAIADRLLAHVANKADRWESLIENCNRLPESAMGRLLVNLRALDPEMTDPASRKRIAVKLRRIVHKHHRFADAHWALPSQLLDELEAIQDLFESDDSVDRNMWLFDQWPELPNEDISWSWQQREAAVFDAQHKALQEIINQHSVSGVFRLARTAAAPGTVGFVVAKAELVDEPEIIPSSLDASDDYLALFARGFVSGRFRILGWEWLDQLDLTTWKPSQIGNLCLVLPFEPKSWDFVASHGEEVSKLYWSCIRVFPGDLTMAEIETAARFLISFRRPLQAAELLKDALYQESEVPPKLLIEILESGLTSLNESWEPEQINSNLGYSIQKLIGKLQDDDSINEEILGKLEWAYLPLLDGNRALPQALHSCLQRDPSFFAEAIQLVYRSRNESEEEPLPLPTGDTQTRARHASSLLESWHAVPGARDGEIDGNELREWVKVARELCRGSGHLEVCDLTIGRVLAQWSAESDGVWPCVTVRDILEEIGTEEILRGLETALVNKHGSYSKSFTDGGQRERDIATHYLKHAKALEIEWPRVAATLRSVAQNFERFAAREDERRDVRL